jgi:LDH2 family malate/lactate/ureidoglycolate dehydrogenase
LRRVPHEELEQAAAGVLERLGATPANAETVARLLVKADLTGHESHGVRLLAVYADSIRQGLTDPAATPRIERDDGTTIVVDGRRAFGQVTGVHAAELAAGRALRHGVAAVAVRGGAHLGRLADAVERAAELGAIAFLFANDAGAGQVVAPFGGAEGRLATNPLAVGIPRARPPHLVLDMATSVAAHGTIRVRERRGEDVPDAWRAEGVLQPLGGMKGYGLALVVEVLAGVLSGTGFSRPDPGPDLQGVFLLALDPGRFLPRERFDADVESLLGYVTGGERLPEVDEILVPGEASWRSAERRRTEGVPVDDATWAELETLCGELGLPFAQSDRKETA